MERPPGRKSLAWCKILWSTPSLVLDSLRQRLPTVGTWLSLVEHSLGVRGVGSSNLPVPTNFPLFTVGPSASLRISPAGSRYAHARTTAQLGVRGVGSSNLPVPTNFFEIRAYAPAADARSPDGFAGANAIRATPMITSTATAVSRPVRSLGMCTASTAITAP